ncbi:uncharacterized protein N7500_010033 [Penicillium coprophilum]|uniref:uncharacterized protein n=1 Tax=Penicillium coprophilum TaxID=36646 RepID=UPI00238D2540|nr:uncharacterized protein N7500_010033 [Penicillium coprophilum]KAJ5154594.1 hypothetical protein N7500_010033 [Penicillium coprophilum]
MDDDYVAQLLAKEAKESSIKYASQGLSAFMPSRPTSNAPKPNTRFLRNLIKVTDNHNTALKLKEEREARERMRQLKYQASGASGALAPTSTDRSSKRHDGREVRGSRDHRRGDREDRHLSHRKRTRSRSPLEERDRSRRHRRTNEKYDGAGEKDRDRHEHRREHRGHESSRRDRRRGDKEHTRRRRDRSYSRSPSRSPHRDRSIDRHRHRRQKRDSGPRSLSRSRSPESYKSRRSKREDASPHGSLRSRLEPNTRHRRVSPLSTITARQNESGNESDPLEDLVGPLPPRQNEAPIRSRGRGAYKHNMSNIDAHFAPGYDPATDVHLEEDKLHSLGQESSRRPVAGLMTKDDDWDMAMEALRDRERWRNKGEERLRTAGIDEAVIDKWKNNTAFAGVDGEGNPEDVQWSKKGEGREWDRGKFVDDDGHIDIRAAW